MPERKVAVVPRVVVAGALGPREYGILLTDERTIFVLESASKAGLGAVLGGAVGAAVAGGLATRKYVDYEHEDLERLASDEANIAVPHQAIRSLEIKKTLGSHVLRMEYVRADGKSKKIAAQIVPNQELFRQGKSTGLRAKEVSEDYARKVQDAFRQALPPNIAATVRWWP